MSWNKIILGLMISSSLYFVACTGHQSSELVAKSVAGKGHMPDKATTEEMNDVEKAMYDHLEVLQNNAFQAHQVVSETVKRIIYCKSGNCDNLNVASYTAPRTQFQILSDVIGAIRQVFKNAPTHKTTQTTLSNEGYNAAQSVSGDYDKACPANVNNKTTPQAPTQTTDNSQDPANKAQRSDLSMPKNSVDADSKQLKYRHLFLRVEKWNNNEPQVINIYSQDCFHTSWGQPILHWVANDDGSFDWYMPRESWSVYYRQLHGIDGVQVGNVVSNAQGDKTVQTHCKFKLTESKDLQDVTCEYVSQMLKPSDTTSIVFDVLDQPFHYAVKGDDTSKFTLSGKYNHYVAVALDQTEGTISADFTGDTVNINEKVTAESQADVDARKKKQDADAAAAAAAQASAQQNGVPAAGAEDQSGQKNSTGNQDLQNGQNGADANQNNDQGMSLVGTANHAQKQNPAGAGTRAAGDMPVQDGNQTSQDQQHNQGQNQDQHDQGQQSQDQNQVPAQDQQQNSTQNDDLNQVAPEDATPDEQVMQQQQWQQQAMTPENMAARSQQQLAGVR